MNGKAMVKNLRRIANKPEIPRTKRHIIEP